MNFISPFSKNILALYILEFSFKAQEIIKSFLYFENMFWHSSLLKASFLKLSFNKYPFKDNSGKMVMSACDSFKISQVDWIFFVLFKKISCEIREKVIFNYFL